MTIADIQAVVAQHYGLTREALLGRSKDQAVAWPRQVAMALAVDVTRKSLQQVGRAFGRDHTTVFDAVQKAPGRPGYAQARERVTAPRAISAVPAHGDSIDSADVRRCQHCDKLYHRDGADRSAWMARKFCGRSCAQAANGVRLAALNKAGGEATPAEIASRNLLRAMIREAAKAGHCMWLEGPAQFRALAKRHEVAL